MSDLKGDYILDTTRTAQERNGKIRTASGLYVDPLNLKCEDIRLVDIAHHLSMICRYTGACPFHYSVAHHSVLVAGIAALRQPWAEPDFYRACLLHDAAEAYLNDIASPVKKTGVMAGYRAAEDAATDVIFAAFGVPTSLLAAVKEYDDYLFRWEVDSFWGHAAHPIFAVSPAHAKEKFLAAAHILGLA